jgi:hypothetical protein
MLLAAGVLLRGAPAAAEDCSFKTPAGIIVEKELMITDLSVVDDPRASGMQGPWSFAHLLTRLAGSDEAARPLVKDWLASWDTPLARNGVTAAPRPGIAAAVARPWMQRDGAAATESWRPDLARAPFRLLAIVYRPDLGVLASGSDLSGAGEVRFVYAVLDLTRSPDVATAPPLPFTVIVEYALPGRDAAALQRWARRWHALGSLDFGPAYNAALAQLTQDVVAAPLAETRPRLRTNEGLDRPWQLREFLFEGGRLAPAPVRNTPDAASADRDGTLARRVNAARGADLPLSMAAPAADVPDRNFRWPQGAIATPALRHNFAMATCNGCHAAETGRKADDRGDPADPHAGFRHVSGRMAGETATLSAFLTGDPTLVIEPGGAVRTFCDLKLRQKALAEALAVAPRPDAGRSLPVARARRGRID